MKTKTHVPNAETLAAIEEVLAGKTFGPIDTGSVKAFVRSIMAAEASENSGE